jgi:hypothetical protein
MTKIVKTKVIEKIEYMGQLELRTIHLPDISLEHPFKKDDKVVVIVIKEEDIVKVLGVS